MLIRFEHIYKQFGTLKVLDDLSFDCSKGGMLTILGPNGSGKTTVLKSILGMVIPDSGSISISGYQLNGAANYRNEIDYLPQIARFPENLLVNELISFIKKLRNRPTRDKELIELFMLEPFLNKKLSNLSGGTRQKINLVLAFMFDSPLIVLDEPTTGLDPNALVHLKSFIKEEKVRGKTLIVTSHIMSFVEELSDEVAFILDGKLYFKGTIDELKTQTEQTNLERAVASILEAELA